MEKPILFNTEMVRAILEGRKTVTRRVIKPQYKGKLYPIWEYPDRLIFEKYNDDLWQIWLDHKGSPYTCAKTPCKPGDILYVRETWAEREDGYVYRADGENPDGWFNASWHPSIHMPKKAARIRLRVNDVRAARLHDMAAADSLKEGVKLSLCGILGGGETLEPFAEVWDKTIPEESMYKYGWNANPWVWVIEFERIERGQVHEQDGDRPEHKPGAQD